MAITKTSDIDFRFPGIISHWNSWSCCSSKYTYIYQTEFSNLRPDNVVWVGEKWILLLSLKLPLFGIQIHNTIKNSQLIYTVSSPATLQYNSYTQTIWDLSHKNCQSGSCIHIAAHSDLGLPSRIPIAFFPSLPTTCILSSSLFFKSQFKFLLWNCSYPPQELGISSVFVTVACLLSVLEHILATRTLN